MEREKQPTEEHADRREGGRPALLLGYAAPDDELGPLAGWLLRAVAVAALVYAFLSAIYRSAWLWQRLPRTTYLAPPTSVDPTRIFTPVYQAMGLLLCALLAFAAIQVLRRHRMAIRLLSWWCLASFGLCGAYVIVRALMSVAASQWGVESAVGDAAVNLLFPLGVWGLITHPAYERIRH